MASVRDYYETDFANLLSLKCHISFENQKLEMSLVYDFRTFCIIPVLWLSSEFSFESDSFLSFVKSFNNNPIEFQRAVNLPRKAPAGDTYRLIVNPPEKPWEISFHAIGRL